jgi:hypothetical protein
MDEPDVVEPDVVEMGGRQRHWRRWAAPIGLLGAGALVGGILTATLTAGASSTPTPTPRPSGVPGYGAPWPGHHGVPGGPGPRGHLLDHTGTVTAVGANGVTIKTSTGTTTYAVISASDIDKNGEAKLSDLKVGDAVRFSVATVNGKATIGILHAGNEALDRPQHGHGDQQFVPPGTSKNQSNTAETSA